MADQLQARVDEVRGIKRKKKELRNLLPDQYEPAKSSGPGSAKKPRKKQPRRPTESFLREQPEMQEEEIRHIAEATNSLEELGSAAAAAAASGHLSLDDWMVNYYFPPNVTSDETNREVVQDMSQKIDDTIRKAQFLERDGLIPAARADDEAFGMEPLEYGIVQALAKEHGEIEEGYLNVCRASIRGQIKRLRKTELEEVDFGYSADFLRQPRQGERLCSLGSRCIVMALAVNYPETVEGSQPGDGFICREWLVPTQNDAFRLDRVLPDDRQMCLLDNRLRTLHLYYANQYKHTEPLEAILTHRDKIDCAGGYRREACIYPTSREKKVDGIDRPFVKFCPGNYTFGRIKVQGEKIKCIRETRADFR